jgi:hypothetical protein
MDSRIQNRQVMVAELVRSSWENLLEVVQGETLSQVSGGLVFSSGICSWRIALAALLMRVVRVMRVSAPKVQPSTDYPTCASLLILSKESCAVSLRHSQNHYSASTPLTGTGLVLTICIEWI